ncbi:GroES-like protein [Macroventuria anomochaeta]|uniref:GroES-like protein n=1 Tax=Macroventuria anomochaeta TaxID=301207 RepID=A0ACB6RUC0_9PLEO|nr:GroES-like protein [Macroventuria anomochaeta]KAF2625526.1 GroES-like protein [Macroventuria anomochaeta]
MGNTEVADRIAEADTPAKAKQLGREVRNFQQKIWDDNCDRVVEEGNYAKFKRNEKLKEILLGTEQRALVETSPNDRLWNIGSTLMMLRAMKTEVSIPQPGEHEVLVKNSFVAQNPTDVQSLDNNAFGDGTALGCDFVGKVEEVGKKVSRHKKGDTITALIWGGEVKGHGAYNEYTIANEFISFKVPNSTSLEAAATVPLACCTGWLALFSKDCLAIDRKSGEQTSVLIWGGSSSVGLYATQIARQHNFNVVTVCT